MQAKTKQIGCAGCSGVVAVLAIVIAYLVGTITGGEKWRRHCGLNGFVSLNTVRNDAWVTSNAVLSAQFVTAAQLREPGSAFAIAGDAPLHDDGASPSLDDIYVVATCEISPQQRGGVIWRMTARLTGPKTATKGGYADLNFSGARYLSPGTKSYAIARVLSHDDHSPLNFDRDEVLRSTPELTIVELGIH